MTNLLTIGFEACIASSWGYSLAALLGAIKWRGRRTHEDPAAPAVSILVPICGDDSEQFANFAALCMQDYPQFQVIFGALEAQDSGLATARRIQAEFPDADITIVSGGEVQGANRKVSNLMAMLPRAKHDLILLCDSDMRVGADYLRRVVSPLAKPNVGMVTCLYRAKNARGIAAKLEALGIGADFLPSVLVANLGGIRFAFGATIILRKSVLAQIGGFERIVDNLADDYLLGVLCREAGYDLVLSTYLPETVIGKESFAASCMRRLRWAKTVRAMQPMGWLGSFVTHSFMIAVCLCLLSGASLLGVATLGIVLLTRLLLVAVLAAGVTKDAVVLRSLWLLPVSDALSFLLYIGSYFGNTIVWRGEEYRLKRGGALETIR